MQRLLFEIVNNEISSFLGNKTSLENKRLIPKSTISYYLSNEEIEEESQYIFFDRVNMDIFIKCSWFGEYPLFYYCGAEAILIHYNLTELVQRMKELGIKVQLDEVGYTEACILDNPLRQRTYFKNVNKCISGHTIKINIENKSYQTIDTWVLPFHDGKNTRTEQSYIMDATSILDNLLTRHLDLINDKQMLIPLSGGYDSRLLVSLAKKSNLNFNSLVFGPKESNEIKVAKEVAAKLSLDLIYTELKNSYYLKYGKEVTEITGGLSSPMHCHLYAILRENHIPNDYLIHGYLGGEYAGGSQPVFSNNYSMTEEEALQKYISKYLENHTLWKQVNEEIRNTIIEDLQSIMAECCMKNLPCHFDEYVHNVDRQFSLIANVFYPVEHLTTLIRPFASKEYAVFFNSLPYEMRNNRHLYINAAKKLFPESFSIGNQSESGRLQIPRKYYLGFYVAMYLATQGKYKFRNSMVFERHHELLDRELKNDFQHAINYTEQKAGFNLEHIEKIGLKRFKETQLSYRTLNLYWIKNLLEN